MDPFTSGVIALLMTSALLVAAFVAWLRSDRVVQHYESARAELDARRAQASSELEAERAELKERHEQAVAELDAARREHWLQRSRLPDACAWSDLKERIEARTQELERLGGALADARAVVAERERAEQALGKAEERLRQTKDELLVLRAEREEQERVRLELESRQGELAALQEDLRLLRQDREAVEFERDRLQRERDEVRHELERARERCEALKDGVMATQRELAIQEAQLAQLDQRRAAQLTSVQVGEQELAELQKRVNAAEERVYKCAAETAKQRATVDALLAEQKALEHSIATLRATQERTVEELRRSGALSEDAEAELWEPVLARPRRRATSAEELHMLEQVQDHLARCGLEFSSRTLHAFHTSLKVADMAPLVVLAGLSGTGKSELPRRYAEAMGMHFLNVPVQPRWDSPQDMFGFYNYLENRFRPTELTRALIQMDRFGAEADRGWSPPKKWKGDLSDQLLIVLLDEMNLARVEYYFSELLSKLETRRGVRRDERLQREKAEVLLEVGRRRDQAAIMRIFVDTNVLFVGTMNEDESTQTLSDKVVDRANVLRFGKPSRLHRRAETDDPRASGLQISHQCWVGWVQGEEALAARDPERRLDRWIAELNEGLARIGKPFAHRTHQAMRAYVANYPEVGPEALQLAMADQVEQRILPKFRGFDPSEPGVSQALDTIARLVGELEDEPLRSSIDKARSSLSHQFEWQGVERAAELEPA